MTTKSKMVVASFCSTDSAKLIFSQYSALKIKVDFFP